MTAIDIATVKARAACMQHATLLMYQDMLGVGGKEKLEGRRELESVHNPL